MNMLRALDHLWLIGAEDHVSQGDGSYLHPLTGPDGCETCFALEEVRKLIESLGKPVQVRTMEDEEAAIGIPETIELEPLALPLDIEGQTTLAVSWDIDELRFAMIRNSDSLDLRIEGALELDGLIELQDKIIGPAIEHARARERAKAEEAERQRVEYAARAEERKRERAERERSQTFRAVSVARTITPNMTVHGRVCASLESARKRQTPGTVIFAFTPGDLIKKLSMAMTGGLNLRFCAKCEPIPNARLHNAHMNGGLPLDQPVAALRSRIEIDIWEAHHAAMAADERKNDA